MESNRKTNHQLRSLATLNRDPDRRHVPSKKDSNMNAETGKDDKVFKGLKGVKAAVSSICLVDGTEGRLYYRGYSIDDLCNGSYEETAYLLLKGELPNVAQLEEFRVQLRSALSLPDPVIDFLKSLPADTNPMSALRSAVSVAAAYDANAEDGSEDGDLDVVYQKAIRLTGMVSTIVAAINRIRAGEEPLPPAADLSFAGNFMYMMTGKRPTENETRAVDLILILHAEHGFNASTFTARVICATLTDIYSAITGAIGALKGKLHGGANTEVLRTLQEIGSVEQIEPWVEAIRARKGKFMGFGHAVYQVTDPRARHLKEYSQRLGEESGEPKWYDMSIRMEELVTAAINKNCNVDFFSASLQHYLGIPGDLFTCVFATSRIAGWCAHIIEQLSDNKIIRPSSHYDGEVDRPYPPLSERG